MNHNSKYIKKISLDSLLYAGRPTRQLVNMLGVLRPNLKVQYIININCLKILYTTMEVE